MSTDLRASQHKLMAACWLVAAISLHSLNIGCSDPSALATDDAAISTCVDPSGDYDGDGLTNAEESCATQRDTDGNGIADWRDLDSDGDGRPDSLEAGEKTPEGKCQRTGKDWPCDTDGDGIADHLDTDSDGDGLSDRDEDPNGDGLLGCCLASCGTPQSAAQGQCILTAVGDIVEHTALVAGQEGCGAGQRCESGHCRPARTFNCSNGETDPLSKDTFGDGVADGLRGTFVCREGREDRPGRTPVAFAKSNEGNWQIALPTSAAYAQLQLPDPQPSEVAGVIDISDPNAEVAGFVISQKSTSADIQSELTRLLDRIKNAPHSGASVTVRASGGQGKTHDGYDTVRDTLVELELGKTTDVSTVRNALVAGLLGRPLGLLGKLPNAFGGRYGRMILRFVTVRRFAFAKQGDGSIAKDSAGNPIDDGDQSKWRLVVVGAVANAQRYADTSQATGFTVDDLSNGTALATLEDRVTDECDVGRIDRLPIADIVWVIDESGSTEDNRQDIINNANLFFGQAAAARVDFRMAVTGVVDPGGPHAKSVGRFCSDASANKSHPGGTDRFLLPTEQALFGACINNPPGYEPNNEYGLHNAYEAIKRHLPRAGNDPSRFRTNATIAIIVATDEVPQSLASTIGYENFESCKLPSDNQRRVDQAIQKYIDLFSGASDPQAAAQFHLISGTCQSQCTPTPNVAHGYLQIAQALGGQIGDICQKDLSATLKEIVDQIIAGASPATLEYVPISTSLAVSLNGVALKRSRTRGFDYNAYNNSLTIVDHVVSKGSALIASYKRWQRQHIVR
ncbi:MAG: hypothetical protein H6707_00675 [Deltaproteobacteria bacterium]|nr:hypothetical protein [Deltaproteobacteria bacterium]